MNKMTFQEAKDYLNLGVRHELRNHFFGEREIYWNHLTDNKAMACGLAGATFTVIIEEDIFVDDQAIELLKCGSAGDINRQDTTGPDEYQDGVCVNPLTVKNLLKEHSGGISK